MSARFERRRAVVTGAARGIGRAIAQRLHAEGALVALLDVDGELAAHEAAVLGERARALTADVSDEGAVREAMECIARAWGGLDVVVANAGIEPLDEDGPVHAVDAAVFRRVVDVNLVGLFLTCKHGLGALLRGSGGALVLTASPTGCLGVAPDAAAYSASKAGAVALMRTIAVRYADAGIRANCVLPGVTATRAAQPALADPAEREALLRPIPLGRAADPAEIAAVVAFLASDDASYVTGAVYAADGGWTAA